MQSFRFSRISYFTKTYQLFFDFCIHKSLGVVAVAPVLTNYFKRRLIFRFRNNKGKLRKRNKRDCNVLVYPLDVNLKSPTLNLCYSSSTFISFTCRFEFSAAKIARRDRSLDTSSFECDNETISRIEAYTFPFPRKRFFHRQIERYSMAGSNKLLRLLCFGDSLTEGWHANGFKFHPYTIQLAELFKVAKKDYEIVNRGLSGELVYPEMVTRFPTILEKEMHYNFAIILAGTNDLSNLNCAKEVDLFKNIKKLHVFAHEKGVKTCAVTIPQTSFDMLPHLEKYVKYREEVNQKIREFVSENSKMVCLCDLSTKLPMFGINENDLTKYWDDDLHLTPQGYDKMADLIFDSIVDYLD